jgi:protein farnesyltransferase/geranylgeranyltransferase type-1 subunit alpha
MPSYAENPLWADVVPIPQEESSTALAQIAYSDGYAEAMAYLRAVMAAGDMSERVLGLTQDIIMMNPAHYTVW